MRKHGKWLGLLSLAGMFAAGGSLFAQEGIVRISDQAPAGAPSAPAPQPAVSYGGGYDGGYGGGVVYGDDCQECYGGQGRRRGCLGCLRGKCNEHYCTHSPGHGFSIPHKYPIHRRGVQYDRYFPTAWHGTAGAGYAAAYPMVYTPTDTTQLGYYYQHVPFWQPEPWRIPARPVPTQWHHLAQPVHASSFGDGPVSHRDIHGRGFRGGQVIEGDVIYTDGGVAPYGGSTGPSPTPLPTPAPSGTELPPTPAPAPASEARGEAIRRAGF